MASIPKVVPGCASPRRAADPVAMAKAEPTWKAKLRMLMWRHKKAEATEDDNQTAVRETKQARQKALQVLFALDHALECVGHGFSSFQVDEKLRCKPLASTEFRYKAPLTGHGSGASPIAGQKFRLAIKDRVAAKSVGRPHASASQASVRISRWSATGGPTLPQP